MSDVRVIAEVSSVVLVKGKDCRVVGCGGRVADSVEADKGSVAIGVAGPMFCLEYQENVNVK